MWIYCLFPLRPFTSKGSINSFYKCKLSVKGERIVLLKIKKETKIELKIYEPCGRFSSIPMSLTTHFHSGNFQVSLLPSPFLPISTGAFRHNLHLLPDCHTQGEEGCPGATEIAVQVPEPIFSRNLILFKWMNAWIFKSFFQEIDKVICPQAILFGFWNLGWFSLTLWTQ